MTESRLVLGLRALQAKVAALLAPGPLPVLEDVARLVRGSLSNLADRSVVRNVCFSGLDDLGVPLVAGEEL